MSQKLIAKTCWKNLSIQRSPTIGQWAYIILNPVAHSFKNKSEIFNPLWTLVARLRRHLVLILTNRTKSKTNSAKQKPLNSSQMTPNAGLRLGQTKERSESRRRQWPTNQDHRRGRGDCPSIFLHLPFFNQGGYIMPTSLVDASLALLNFQTFLRPC